VNTAGGDKEAHREGEPDDKGYSQTDPQLRWLNYVRLHMEIASQIFVFLTAAGLGIAAMLAIFAHHRDFVIWFTWFGLICAFTAGTCWFQDKEWKRDLESKGQIHQTEQESSYQKYSAYQ
jgi:hypothetical protein